MLRIQMMRNAMSSAFISTKQMTEPMFNKSTSQLLPVEEDLLATENSISALPTEDGYGVQHYHLVYCLEQVTTTAIIYSCVPACVCVVIKF
ncbi:hypothetical protein Ciccas_004366 [Cichlidogyrus casuarinus]|uniref:Uncharacterized protein n=1 Tax=Cichlidogyrus casuarinus TaxID=1844966 RepID=A0ABD2QBS0_9PLAT